MTEKTFQWRKMTSEEQDQWDPAGVHWICTGLEIMMMDLPCEVTVAVDEYVICIQYSLPQSKPWDADALLAMRDHGMEMEKAKRWLEETVPQLHSTKDLAELRFRTELV